MFLVSSSQQWGLTGTVVEVCDGHQVSLLVDLVQDLQHFGHRLALQAPQVLKAQMGAGSCSLSWQLPLLWHTKVLLLLRHAEGVIIQVHDLAMQSPLAASLHGL